MNNSLWKTWGASVIGPSHAKLGIPNQDAWMSRGYKWGEVIVVSDGLGSKPHSDLGSKAACWAVFEAAKLYHNNREAKTQDVLRLIHAYWLIKIAPFSAHDCAATCLFAIRLQNQLILAQLGDGLIAVHANEQEHCRLLNDNKEESFANLTYSLSQEFRGELWKVSSVAADRCNAVVLCTDGIADDLLPEKQMDFVKDLYLHYQDFNPQKRKREIKKWLKNWPVTGHSDDKTLVCLLKK